MAQKKFTRSSSDVKLSGLCAGIAHYFDLDVTLVRLIYAVLTIFSAAFPGIILYILATLITPKD